MNAAKKRVVSRIRRAFRIRKKISGTAERPRLCVRRSLKHIYAQLVDDEAGVTLAQAGSTDKGITAEGTKSDVAKVVGEALAERAKAKGIDRIVFDRKGYRYHGRVKALADGAREKGLSF